MKTILLALFLPTTALAGGGYISGQNQSVSQGGTGATTFGAGQILIGQGTNAVTSYSTFTLTAAGNVGIGITNPTSTLNVKGATNIDLNMSASGSVFDVAATNDANAALVPLQLRGTNIIMNPTSGSVGIGTANPGSKLWISSGPINVDGNVNPGLVISVTGTSPAATFTPALSSFTATGALSGTYTNTTLGQCISGSTVTLTPPTGCSGLIQVNVHGTASVNSLAAVMGKGLIVDGAFIDGETAAKGLSAPMEAVSTDGTDMGFSETISGLSCAAHNICLSLFVSAGTGTIDSTNSVMKLQAYTLP